MFTVPVRSVRAERLNLVDDDDDDTVEAHLHTVGNRQNFTLRILPP